MSNTDKKVVTSLKAMAAQGDGAVKKDDGFKVDPRVIVEAPGFNLRNYDDAEVVEQIESFAASWAAGEFIPPLLVRVNDDGKIELIDGHQRLRGAMLAIERGADIGHVKVVRFYGNDTERVETMLRSASGLPLKPLEIAMGYLRLHRAGGYSVADIAAKMHTSDTNVRNKLMLATANADVQKMVREGQVAADEAIKAVREHGEKAGAYLAQHLQKAQDQGKSKVTAKTMQSAPSVSKKVVSNVIERFRAAAPVFRAHAKSLSDLVEKDGVQALHGRKVELDAQAFYELLQANQALEEALNKGGADGTKRTTSAKAKSKQAT